MRSASFALLLAIGSACHAQFCQVYITPAFGSTVVTPGTTGYWSFGLSLSGSGVPQGTWQFSGVPGGSIDQGGFITINMPAGAGGTYLGQVSWFGSCNGTYSWPTATLVVLTQAGSLLNASPQAGNAPLAVNFSASVVVPFPTYSWLYGDGSSGFSLSPGSTHVYTTPGMYQTSVLVQTSGTFAGIYQGPVINVGAAPITIASIKPPVAGVNGGDLIEISGGTFSSSYQPVVLIGGQAATGVTVLGCCILRCLAPGAVAPGPASVTVQYPGGTATAPLPLEYVPVITQVTGSLDPSVPATLDVDGAGFGGASSLLVNGTVVLSSPTPTGLQATISPSLWQPLGFATLQVTSAGTNGYSSRGFVVPGTSATNIGICSGFPLGASSGTTAWVEVSGVPPAVGVTLVGGFLPAPVVSGWPGPGEFIVAVGSSFFTLSDGMGLFGWPTPNFSASPAGIVGRTIVAPPIMSGMVIRLQAAYSAPGSPLGFSLTWATTLTF